MRVVWVGLLAAVAIGAGLAFFGLGEGFDTASLRVGDPGEGATDPAPDPAADVAADLPPRGEADRLFDAGNLDAARASYVAVIEQDPDDVEARLRLTLIALLRQDWDAAARHGDEVVRLAPDSPEAAAVAAALAHAEAGDGDAATAAVPSARDALRVRPDLLVARWVVVRSLLGGDDPCRAVPEIDAAIALAPNLYELEELKLSAYGQAGDRRRGLAQLEHMHRRFPSNAQLSEWLFQTYDATGDAAAATAVLRDVVQVAGEALAPRLRLAAYVRSAQGDGAADAELSRMAEDAGASPLASRLRMELAASQFRQGRAEEAVGTLEAVLALPGLASQEANAAKTELARMLRASGEDGRASGLLDEVLQADPGHVEALKARAAGLIEAGRPREALTALRAALGQSPDDAAALVLMAQAYRLEGSDALAGDSLVRAAEASGGGAAETELLAQFLREQGQEAAADAALASVADPGSDAGAVATGSAAPPAARECPE